MINGWFALIAMAAFFAAGFGLGMTRLYNRQPPKIKRLMDAYEDDCQPCMLVGFAPGEWERDFRRRWELDTEKPKRRIFWWRR